MVKEKTKKQAVSVEELTLNHELILFNDEVNTFDFVIETLIDVCGHQPEQAEQLTLIVHYKGKCGVKTGEFIELKPMFDEMSNRGLTVNIE